MNLSTIVDKLELNPKKYSNLELILKLLDKVYENKKLFINTNNNDESCILLIKLVNPLEEIINYEIKLYKHYMKIDDKFNMLYNQFKLFKSNNIDNDKIIEMKNEINELNTKLEQKDKEIKDILNQKDNVINEMNKKIINQESRIKDLENKNINIFNENKNLKELFNKHENESKMINEKIAYLENNFKDINNNLNQINEIITNVNNLKKEINKLNNEIRDKDKNNNEEKLDIKIKEEINKIENNINMKFKEQQNINDKINNFIHDIEYEKKINYEFKKEPKNLKFKENITTTNSSAGWNDIFEIFISYKDNKEYLVSPNTNNYKLDIFNLINNQLITSLSGHKNDIRTIRYSLLSLYDINISNISFQPQSVFVVVIFSLNFKFFGSFLNS